MYFIGIDHSLRHTGVCLLRKDEPEFKRIVPKKRRGAIRLFYIYNQIQNILDEYDCIYGAVEGGSYGSKGVLYELGGVNGIVQVSLFEDSIPFVEVAPNTLKKFLTGDGRANKKDMRKHARDEISDGVISKKVWKDERADLADAYALAKMAKCIGKNIDVPGDEGDAIDSVLSNEDRVNTPEEI